MGPVALTGRDHPSDGVVTCSGASPRAFPPILQQREPDTRDHWPFPISRAHHHAQSTAPTKGFCAPPPPEAYSTSWCMRASPSAPPVSPPVSSFPPPQPCLLNTLHQYPSTLRMRRIFSYGVCNLVPRPRIQPGPHVLGDWPSSSVHAIFQAKILECITIPFSRGSSQPRD